MEPNQKSVLEFFANIIEVDKALTIFAESFITDGSQFPEFASEKIINADISKCFIS